MGNECWLKDTTSVTLFADPYYEEEEELEYLSGFSCPGSPCSEDKCVEACAEGWEENDTIIATSLAMRRRTGLRLRTSAAKKSCFVFQRRTQAEPLLCGS